MLSTTLPLLLLASYMSCLVAATEAPGSMSDVYQTPTAATTQAPVAIIISSFPVSPMPTSTEAASTSGAATVTVVTSTTSNGGSTSTSTSSDVPVSTNAAGRSEHELMAVAGAALAGVLVVV